MREPGDLLLVACYELGHQPLAVAWPAAFLERAGYRPALMDTSVEPVDAQKLARAKVVAVSVPMHTALRLGLEVAARARAVNPGAHICFFGLYATLNADYLFAHGADSVIGGEAETPLCTLVDALERGDTGPLPAVGRPGQPAAPHLKRLDFPVPSRAGLPSIKQYAHVERDGRMDLVAYAESSRGCLHRCRHCPIPPVYGGRFFAVPRAVVLADIRQQIEAGARHVTFGDPDFLNGPTHALAVARELHAEDHARRSSRLARLPRRGGADRFRGPGAVRPAPAGAAGLAVARDGSAATSPGPARAGDALLPLDASRPAHGPAPGGDCAGGGPGSGGEGRRARHLRPGARDGGGGGRRVGADAGGHRHGQGPQAPAPPHRGVVLLSGAHPGPVGPDVSESPLAGTRRRRREGRRRVRPRSRCACPRRPSSGRGAARTTCGG